MKRLLVFGILLLGLVLVGCTQVQQTQDDLTEKWMPQNARSCIDTDQVPPTNTGHDSAAYGIKGTTISTGVFSQRRTDSCAADGKLLEYYCENKAIRSETYACPNGCKDGACVQASCKGDSSKNIYANSKIYINSNEFREYCRDANTKLELWCKSSTESGTEWVTCENGCKGQAGVDAACVKTATPTPTPAITACREAGGSCVSIRDVSRVYRNCDSDGSKRRLDCGDWSKYCCVPKSNPTATPTPTPSATPTATATATPTPTPTATVTATPTPGTYVACGANNAGKCYQRAIYSNPIGTQGEKSGCPAGYQEVADGTATCGSSNICCATASQGSCESTKNICYPDSGFGYKCYLTGWTQATDTGTGSCGSGLSCCIPPIKEAPVYRPTPTP